MPPNKECLFFLQNHLQPADDIMANQPDSYFVKITKLITFVALLKQESIYSHPLTTHSPCPGGEPAGGGLIDNAQVAKLVDALL